MIDLYTWATPNGRKISIALEEFGLPYKVIPIDIGKGEQFTPEFSKISPNNKIPAIVDHDSGQSLMESGAILMYLAEKTGRFMPASGPEKWTVIQWLMMQMGHVGPMLGQTHHFVFYNKGKAPYAEERYLKENARIYKVLDTRLGQSPYLGAEYSIADIATWPWISRFGRQQMNLSDYPNLRRWYVEIAQRPAVQTGYHIPQRLEDVPMPA
ncbi:MAG TPA: glutathione S-transferase N-terminal domain-containing protein [Gammaproteobacteria bacterium]|nr:glutathione S-transferase N-terminal domain-containing protein [Gammaproteobacteria bacterium]